MHSQQGVEPRKNSSGDGEVERRAPTAAALGVSLAHLSVVVNDAGGKTFREGALIRKRARARTNEREEDTI